MNNEMIQSLRINGDRLWRHIMEMAEIGATAKGGSNRQALTDEDRAGRDLFVSWCADAGLDVRVDQMGNIFAWRSGSDLSHLPVLAGSHLDSQPTGGRFDGVYGVLAALEVVETLNDQGVETVAPLIVASWTNEEGSRFVPAMMGSGVFAGVFDLQETWLSEDKSGASLKDELERITYLGNQPVDAFPIRAAFEVHIEQGPILESEARQIGIVTGVQGLRWYDVYLLGDECHAGPTPMGQRRDPFRALGPILESCYQMARELSPWARVTFGDIKAAPGTRNSVPGQVTLSIDMRHHEVETLDLMDARLKEFVTRHCESAAIDGTVKEIWHMPVTQFDPGCVAAVRRAAEQLGFPSMEMVSGAGHDSLYTAKVAPTSMIFVPCENGLSHNEAENASPADLEAGCNVLLHAMLHMASDQV
jgi:N-carbamoyl-L-amino-acid hydrolase